MPSSLGAEVKMSRLDQLSQSKGYLNGNLHRGTVWCCSEEVHCSDRNQLFDPMLVIFYQRLKDNQD